MFKINYKYFLNGLKITITLLSLIYLIHVFENRQNILIEIGSELLSEKSNNQWIALVLAFVFVFFNMGFEAKKWQYLVSKIEKTSFWVSFKSILTGSTLGLITPQALGDYASRIYFLKDKNAKEAAGLVFLARIAQFYITILYGFMAFLAAQHLFAFESNFFGFYSLSILFLITFFSFSFLLFASSFVFCFKKYAILKKTIPYFIGIAKCNLKDFGIVFGLSWLRFLVFSAQYLLFLYFFGIDVSQITVVLCVWLTFFTKSILPALGFFSEITLREAAAIYFFTKAGMEIDKIMLASLSLWIINNILPSLAGLIVILKLKNSRTN